jgi:Phage integrase family
MQKPPRYLTADTRLVEAGGGTQFTLDEHHVRLLTRLLQACQHDGASPTRRPRTRRPRKAETLAGIGGKLETFVRIALHTGMRPGEVCALTWNNVDVLGGAIYVRDPKSNEDRTVPLHRQLQTYLAGVPRTKGRVVRLVTRRARTLFNALVAELGWPDVHPHTLRHLARAHERDPARHRTPLSIRGPRWRDSPACRPATKPATRRFRNSGNREPPPRISLRDEGLSRGRGGRIWTGDPLVPNQARPFGQDMTP